MADEWDDTGVLIEPTDTEHWAGMGGVTSYSIVEGEFYLKALPSPEKQYVKRTVQGISDSFTYETFDLSVNSLVNESDRVKITELVYEGEVHRVMNEARTKTATMGKAPSHPYNRIICEYGSGQYMAGGGQNVNMSSSTCDEIIAIAIDDIKPFLLKTLSSGATAQLRSHQLSDTPSGVSAFNYKPTNDVYVQHLTPEDEPRVAIIQSPAILIAAGGPKQIKVYYDAIDLTGEVIAGTGIASASNVVNLFAQPWIKGDNDYAGHLVVKKTVPSGGKIYSIGGAIRTLSDILKRPWDLAGATPSADAIPLVINSPGGIISIPTKNLNKPLKSHVLMSSPTGNITPSPFVNTEDCIVNNQKSYAGYGRPKAIPSIVVPDPTTNADHHLMRISCGVQKADMKGAKTDAPLGSMSSVFSMSSNRAYDIIDNEITMDEMLILVHPMNRDAANGLSDFTTDPKSTNPSIISIEYTLMKGRIEEIEPGTSTSEDSGITIRGRSLLMDLADQTAKRDFNLSDGTPIKEIGDLGTPTVSLSLGGPGQGAIDIKPSRIEHPIFPGWKDRIVGSGNASVRNDKQASTYYASTRALVELPLFPSMFFDIEKIIDTDGEKRTPLPSGQGFEMTIDCTMTAINRPEMKNQESRFSIDWGLNDVASSFEVTDTIYKQSAANAVFRPLIRCQRPSQQAVITAVNPGTYTITVDDITVFTAAVPVITFGEGILGDGFGYVGKFTKSGGNNLTATVTAEVFDMSRSGRVSEAASNAAVDWTKVHAGMTVIAGGYLVGGITAVETWDLSYSTHASHSKEAIALDIHTGIGFLLQEVATRVQDPTNAAKYWILNGPNMEAFDFDCDEVLNSFADRQLVQGVDCRPAALSLKGKSSDGNSLKYVMPLTLDLSQIASVSGDFKGCVNEVIRRVNMAAHPQAKNSAGGSAFDPPQIFSTTGSSDTGSHMGYVRAFEGIETESRGGEDGMTIVIHSTVPGATSRNFAVWLDNKSPYPYRPIKAVGSGGLVATNSLHYQANSFPAPLPIGSDGETYVPITTFTGGMHGPLLNLNDAPTPRTYSGIGKRLTTKTIAPIETEDTYATLLTTGGTNVCGRTVLPQRGGLAQTINALGLTYVGFNPAGYPSRLAPIIQIAVDMDSKEAALGISKEITPANRGILKMNGKMAYFNEISPQSDQGTIATNAMWIKGVTPFTETQKFYDELFITDNSGVEQDAVGLEIEILYPLMNSRGILFFGGGHTGVMIDVSDGTSNDYSSHYKHHYSKGPTGFAGLQNINETHTASAILDFTKIKDMDTVNENTYIGKHHIHQTNSDGMVVDDCCLYLPMYEEHNKNLAKTTGTLLLNPYPQNDETILKEHIYGKYQKLNLPNGGNTALAAHVIQSHIDKPIKMHPHVGAGAWPTDGYPYLVCHDVEVASGRIMGTLPNLGGAQTAIGSRVQSMSAFSISFFINQDYGYVLPAGGVGEVHGPVFHALDPNGLPWGISVGGKSVTSHTQYFSPCLHATHHDGTPIYARVNNALYAALYAGPMLISKGTWHHVVFVHDGNSSGATLSTCKLYINGGDHSAFLEVGVDKLYETGVMANSRQGTARRYPHHADQGTPTAEGVPDHPYVPLANGPASTVDATKSVRANGMATVGVALHGAPFTAAGHYFDQDPVATVGSLYGTPQVVPPTDGHNQVGPIYFTGGSLAHIAVWDRAFTLVEAQALYNSRLVW